MEKRKNTKAVQQEIEYGQINLKLDDILNNVQDIIEYKSDN